MLINRRTDRQTNRQTDKKTDWEKKYSAFQKLLLLFI
jgi:hypothetical protein